MMPRPTQGRIGRLEWLLHHPFEDGRVVAPGAGRLAIDRASHRALSRTQVGREAIIMKASPSGCNHVLGRYEAQACTGQSMEVGMAVCSEEH